MTKNKKMSSAKNQDLSKIDKLLKKKTILYSLWDCESKTSWTNYQFDSPLKEIFGRVITFDPRKRRFMYGSESMRATFLKIIKEKKPDYVFFMVGSDEMNIDTIEEINKISPKTKTIALLTDEDTEFEVFSRYYALFVDYCMVTQPKYLAFYRKDGLKNGIPMVGLNLKLFKPLNLKKRHDISFVGQQYPPRVELIRFLISNGIKISLWGPGWFNYPEFKEIHKGGAIDVEKYVEVLNQSKITLGLVKNKYGNPHISHRPFEAGACKAFQILDYAPEYWPYLKKDKEVVMFKNKDDLIKKIRFYSKNDQEREKIVERSYKRIVNEYDIVSALKDFFKLIVNEEKYFVRKPALKSGKTYKMSKEDTNLGYFSLKKELKGFDYVSFSAGKSKEHKYKNYLQVHSLEKTKKDISCCDYFISSKELGNYLLFKSFRYFKFANRKDFCKLVNINQLIVRKGFFLKNIEIFKDIFNGGEINIISEKNTAFVSIPLVSIEKLSKLNYNTISELDALAMNKAFQLNFVFKLYSLIYRKKLLYDFYPYKLLTKSIFQKNLFILKYLFNSLFSKEDRSKMRTIKSSHVV